jgi:multicomponent Na+:H+ antiporter subunit E
VRRLLATAWLVIVWVALWGQLSWANLLGGVAVALLIGLAFPGTGAGPAGRVRPLPAVHFAGWFAYKLVEATLAVSLEVLRAHPRIAEGIIAVRLGDVSAGLATLVANVITLTPGTMTLEVSTVAQGTTLYVHCLHADDTERVRADLQRLAALAEAAFPGAGHGAGPAPRGVQGPA